MLAICHSSFSLQAGVRDPGEWASAASSRGYEAVAICDISGLYGAVHAWRAVEAAGLRPIVGAEFFPLPEVCCTVLVQSNEGYRQLCRLLSAYHLNQNFCFPDAAVSAGVGELIFICRSGLCEGLIREVVPSENLYVMANGYDRGRLWSHMSSDLSLAPLPDAWFIESEDRRTFADLAQLRLRGRHPERVACDHDGVVLPMRGEWAAAHPEYEAVAAEIVERCRFEFDFEACHLPRLDLPFAVRANQRLSELCRSAVTNMYREPRLAQARERLAYEIEMIQASGFADYFLYVNEIIGFAKGRGIPVEVRGSAASSIVSYLLGFTHCCPIEHDLYFERFMNPGRRDCPDIDVDIADNRRDEVVSFCYDRWGEDHVAMVATIQTYRARGALRDAARLLGIDSGKVSRFIEYGDSFPGVTELCETAARLTGLPRHMGVHCGGLIITPFPLTDIAPLFRSSKGVVTIHYEKDQAEMLGLVKMDLLGNSALSVIEEGMRWLADKGERLDEPGPRCDYKVNRLFAKGDTLGIYQCESPGMRQMCRALRPTTRKQVAMALSLIRPGPAAAGMKDAFIRRLRGLEDVSYLHPRMAEFLDNTYGVMLYQEDVMKVAVKLAGYTLADADNLRRAVKGKGGAIFREEKNRFVFEKAAEAGVSADIASAVWDQVSKFASYSYCKAHASVYGRLAWLTARLKAHHPREFYAAILNCHKSMYPGRVFVWDAQRHGIPILPPDITCSEIDWRPTRKGVRAGLGNIRGVRKRTVQKLLAERRRRPFADIVDVSRRVDFQLGELERMVLLGSCRVYGERSELLDQLADVHDDVRQMKLFDGFGRRSCKRLPPIVKVEWTLLGMPISVHPVAIVGRDICQASDMPLHIDRRVSMFGILDAVKYTKTNPKDKTEPRTMSFATLEDPSGLFEVVLFPDTHERFGGIFKSVGPYLVTGQIKEQWDSVTLTVDEALICA